MKATEEIQGTEKEFLSLFNELCRTRSSWQVWAALMSVIACTISNSTELNKERRKAREEEYERYIKELGGSHEIPAKIFAVIVMAYEKNPNQDFLGKMYMQLNLGSHWHGQFFTPYCICELMSGMTVLDEAVPVAKIKDYISCCDCACGAGATLIAAANTFKKHNVNYQKKVLFVAQDIDRVVAQMCYIQLSLLGCAGYVVVANSLTNPVLGMDIEPVEQKTQEFWYTPMYYSVDWVLRRMRIKMRTVFQSTANNKDTDNEDGHIFFFNFDKEVVENGRNDG